MDPENFIKIEHDQPQKSMVNFCMTHFYNDDISQDNIEGIKQQPFDDTIINHHYILENVQQIVDLRTTPLQQTLNTIVSLFTDLTSHDLEILRKLIIKRKNALKRIHAKKRPQSMTKKEYYVFTDLNFANAAKEQIQNEIKKKRNRMSAQISRDRRKIMIQQLESDNQKLKSQSERMRIENERLKRQLAELNNHEKAQEITKPHKNKFISLLIMFGIFFLFTLLRDSKNSANSFKIEEKVAKPVKHQFYSACNQGQMIQASQKTFVQLEDNPKEAILGDDEMLNSVIGKLEGLKLSTQDIQIPIKLKQTLQKVAKEHL